MGVEQGLYLRRITISYLDSTEINVFKAKRLFNILEQSILLSQNPSNVETSVIPHFIFNQNFECT